MQSSDGATDPIAAVLETMVRVSNVGRPAVRFIATSDRKTTMAVERNILQPLLMCTAQTI